MDDSGRVKRGSWDNLYQPYEDLAYLIVDIGDAIVVVFGMFGNVMVILIMLRLPSSMSSVFFTVLAMSDQMVLTDPLENFLQAMYYYLPIYHQGTWQCKIGRYLEFVVSLVSSWMLVSLTMLRAASVLWPLRVGVVWTKRKSRAAAGIVSTVLLLVNSHLLYGFNIDDRGVCHIHASELYEWFALRIDSWIYLLQLSFFPFIMLLLSNSILLRTLVRSVEINKDLSTRQASQGSSRQQKVSSLTVTLVTANVSFFLLTAPVAIFLVYEDYIDWSDPIHRGQLRVFSYTSTVLQRLNSGINFYLYCLTGTKFRAEFMKIAQECYDIFCKTKTVSSEQNS